MLQMLAHLIRLLTGLLCVSFPGLLAAALLSSFRRLQPESSLRPPTRLRPAPKHPAAPSGIPADAGIHPHLPRPPIPAKKRPIAAEEFFRQNS